MPALTIPRIEGGSQKEFLKAIKGDPGQISIIQQS
jgi:hypothetical protein